MLIQSRAVKVFQFSSDCRAVVGLLSVEECRMATPTFNMAAKSH